jgi:hypothetical protein
MIQFLLVFSSERSFLYPKIASSSTQNERWISIYNLHKQKNNNNNNHCHQLIIDRIIYSTCSNKEKLNIINLQFVIPKIKLNIINLTQLEFGLVL